MSQKKIAAVAAFPFFLLLVSWFAQEQGFSRANAVREYTRVYLDSFLADAKTLADEPIFYSPQGRRNAGPILNSRLRWLDVPNRPGNVQGPELPVPVQDALADEAAEIFKEAPLWRTPRPGLDTSWIDAARDFDYWDLEHDSPRTQMGCAPESVRCVFHGPRPDLTFVSTAVRLHLVEGLARRQALFTLQRTRHFAQLLLTTESLPLFMVGLHALELEREAYQAAVVQKILNPGDWHPVQPGVTSAARRFFLSAGHAYFSLFADTRAQEKIDREIDPRLNVCADLDEALPLALIASPFLEPQWPLVERDFARGYSTLDHWLHQTEGRCRLVSTRRAWDVRHSPEGLTAMWSDPSQGGESQWAGLRSAAIPFVRRFLGIFVVSDLSPSNKTAYEKL